MRNLLIDRLRYSPVFIGIAAILGGCASARIAPMTGRELVGLDERWATATVEGDVDRIMTFWSDNATLYPEGHPPVYGKPAIREFIERRQSRPGSRITWTPCCAGIEEGGSMAYTLGEGSASVVDDAGVARELHGRFVAIWRKEGSEWRCTVKCWNASPREHPAGL
jgi:ketosteroid isomerase-like protein